MSSALVLTGTPRRVFPGRWRSVGDFIHVLPCAGYGTFWARFAATVGPGLVPTEVYSGQASLWWAVPDSEDTRDGNGRETPLCQEFDMLGAERGRGGRVRLSPDGHRKHLEVDELCLWSLPDDPPAVAK